MVRRLAGILSIVLLIGIGMLTVTALKMRAAEPPQPNVRTERLEGATAAAHIQRILAEKPAVRAAYERAEASLSSRGFRKVGKPLVLRKYRILADASPSPLERLVQYLMPTLVAQNEYNESTTDGEIFMDPWDDGDNVTWEGSFYVTRYSDGAWALYDWQNDTRNENESYYMYYANRDGGYKDGGPYEVRRNLFDRILGFVETPVSAQSTVMRKAKRWADCWGGSCLGAAAACAFSGPGWGLCTAGWCTAGSTVACGIIALLM